MNRKIKSAALVGIFLSLTACASTGSKSTLSPQISYAPAIDVSYTDVVKNVPEHLGVNVRWGGQIIAVEQADTKGSLNTKTSTKTKLTLLAYPLKANGKPDTKAFKNFQGGRFIVETESFDSSKSNRFITVYGPISSQHVLTNGKLKKTIPVITAVDTKEWTSRDQRAIAQSRYGLRYNGLGIRYGLGYGAGFGHSSFGHRGFSSFRYGFSPYYRSSFYSGHRGFGRSRFH